MSDSSAEEVVVTPATNQEAPVVASAATETTDATPAASSTAEAKPAETTFDRIKAAVTKSEVSPTSKEPEPAVVADPDSDAQKTGDEVSPEELATWHAKTRERFTKLTSNLKAKDGEIEVLTPKAAEYDKIDTFIKNAGLSPQDVGSTLQIAAMLVNDKAKARERLLPIMAELDRVLGETLPAELQQRVDAGYLTQEDARAVARSAAAAALAESRANKLTEQQQADNDARQSKQLVDSTISAVETWEKAKAVADPDWHTKREEVAEQVEIATERKARELGRPYFPTAEEAVKLSEAALKTVDARRKRFAPKPKAIDPPVNQGASPRSVVAPKNTLDIIRQVTGTQ